MQTEPLLDPSRAVEMLRVNQLSIGAKAKSLFLGDVTVYCWENKPFMVLTGAVLYVLDQRYASAQMKYINAVVAVNSLPPLVRVSARDFDFIVGSALTKLGLLLTRAPRENNDRNQE